MAKNKKSSTAGIFFSFFLKAIVIILGLVILAMGAYLIKQIISQKNTKVETKGDDSAFEDTQEDELMMASTNDATDDELLFGEDSEGQDGSGTTEIGFEDSIVVLNATEAVGLAKAWKEKLEAEGFKNVQTGNYLNGVMETSKIVVAEEGTGGNLQQYLPNAKMESLPPGEIAMDAPSDGVKAVFIIGNADNIVSQ
ncbi:MAG: LytR C-terminal domain-containing protein [Eubacterium sp.]|nr:LytR C-terminal domain-containing protein [Eubacterium sp.]